MMSERELPETNLVDCPLCTHQTLEVLEPAHDFDSFTTKGDEFTFRIGATSCAACGFIFLNPRASQAQMYAYYERQSRIPRSLASLGIPFSTLLDLQASFIRAHWQPPAGARLLDVGGAEGFFLERLAREVPWGAVCEAVEPSTKYAEAARAVLPGAVIHECMLEDAPLEQDAFDLVTLRHVMEHVQSPRAALRIIRRVLKPTGVLHLELPNVANWPPSVSSMFHHEHLNYFTRETMAYALALEGFRPVALEAWDDNPELSGFAYPVLRVLAVPVDNATVVTPDASEVVATYRRQTEARRHFIERVVGDVAHRIRALASLGKRLTLFGAGPHTLDLLHALKLPSSIWSRILDNNPNKTGKSMKGIPVVLPSRDVLDGVAAVVISSEEFESEMAAQVRGFDVPGLEIITLYAR
jgi:2-polyprenyl-3-methyl-5-hydroxy-6-metoxy-1,4-benzoquinol methylase